MTSGRRRAEHDDRTAAPDDASAELPDRVVLVGFMAAGKSTVGRRLARRLGYRFVDLDDEVERRAGRSIPEIFREDGETRFRELEAAVTRDFDSEADVVVAAGGGWMARSELRDRWPDAVRIWLTVEPETVLERVGEDVEGRPMLDPGDPLGSIRTLLADRAEAYGRAELRVVTDDASPGEVADRILAELRSREAGAAGTP